MEWIFVILEYTLQNTPIATHSRRRRLSDVYEAIHRLSDAYETSLRLSDAYGHIFKKKNIFVIFGRFKKINPRAVGFFHRILDRNVVVPPQ